MRHATRRRKHRGGGCLAPLLTVASLTGLVLPLLGAGRLRAAVLALPVTERPNGFTVLLALLAAGTALLARRRHPDDQPLPGPWSDYWASEDDWGRHHYPHDPEQ